MLKSTISKYRDKVFLCALRTVYCVIFNDKFRKKPKHKQRDKKNGVALIISKYRIITRINVSFQIPAITLYADLLSASIRFLLLLVTIYHFGILQYCVCRLTRTVCIHLRFFLAHMNYMKMNFDHPSKTCQKHAECVKSAFWRGNPQEFC